MSNDTPRTEAMIDSCGDYEKAYHYRGRFAEFARSLERENAKLREALRPIAEEGAISMQIVLNARAALNTK